MSLCRYMGHAPAPLSVLSVTPLCHLLIAINFWGTTTVSHYSGTASAPLIELPICQRVRLERYLLPVCRISALLDVIVGVGCL